MSLLICMILFSTSLRKVVDMHLDQHLEEFKVVSGGASREYALELSLATMKATWDTLSLQLTPHP